jgi:hypothetical protein
MLDALESKKLILRNRKSDDRRKVLLSLTPRGLKTVRVVEDVGKEIEEIVSDFNETEQELLGELLLKISNKLVDKGCMFTTGICTTCCFFKLDKYTGSVRPHYCEFLDILLSDKDIYKECPYHKQELN